MLVFVLTVAAVFAVASPLMLRAHVSVTVAVLAVGYPGLAVVALLLFRPQAAQSVGLDAAPDTYYEMLSPWHVVGPFIVIGVLVYSGGLLGRMLLPQVADVSAQARQLRLQLGPAALWIAALAAVSQLLGVGLSTVLNAPRYLDSTGPPILLNIGGALLPVAVVICANVLFNNHRRRGRVAALLLLLVLEIFLLGQATRLFCVSFVLIFVGALLTGRWRSSRKALLYGAISISVAIVSLGIPLTLRGETKHGLEPALGYLFSNPGQFFSGQSNPFYNALLGIPLSLYEGYQISPIPHSALAISLNPAPGGLAGWTTLAPTLRLNIYEPYSALGELLNYGWEFAAPLSVVVGLLFEVLTNIARRQPGLWSSAFQAMIVGTGGLLLVRSTQYNLRTEARLIYYLIAVIGLLILARTVSGKRFPVWRRDDFRKGTARAINTCALPTN